MKSLWSSIRAVISVIVVAGYVYLAVTKTIDPKDYQAIVLAIVVFYFNKPADNNPPVEGPRT